MKSKAILFIFSILLFCSFSSFAQRNKKNKSEKDSTELTTKTEKPKKKIKVSKELKREMQEYYYDIEKFEFLKSSMAEAKAKAVKLNEELEKLKQQESDNNVAIESLAAEKDKNQATIKELEEKSKQKSERKAIPSEGVFFTIQIGAFNKMNLSNLINQNEADLSIETDQSGLKKYLLGGYLTYDEAAESRKKLRKLGAKDAWIVAYKDGKRVNMNEVRDTPISEEELKELKSIKPKN